MFRGFLEEIVVPPDIFNLSPFPLTSVPACYAHSVGVKSSSIQIRGSDATFTQTEVLAFAFHSD